MKFLTSKSHIHLIARGFLVCEEEVILCRVKGANWFFLPGGHVEDGESARDALFRELKEEIGFIDFKVTTFMGVCENIFSLDNDTFQHEINIIFQVNVPPKVQLNAKEAHLEFVRVFKNDLKEYKILPIALKEGLLQWLKDRKPFLKEI